MPLKKKEITNHHLPYYKLSIVPSLTRRDLNKFLNNLLAPYDFSDYGPNGLQIEGKQVIKKIAFAVSATAHSIAQTVHEKADCLIVHHGLFWSFHGAKKITGAFHKRIAPLIKSDINLFAYHLPLDAHLEHGNAACLAHALNMTELTAFGDYKGSPTGVKGKLTTQLPPLALKVQLENILNHPVLLACPDESALISSIGIITGGANSDWVKAQRAGLQAYITGEMSEHDWHEAQEANIHMFAGGHNATESLGIQSLQRLVAKNFTVETLYIPSKNPA